MECDTGTPAGMGWVNPYLPVRDVRAAMEFYAAAFGLEQGQVFTTPSGRAVYGEVRHGSGVVLLGCPTGNAAAPAGQMAGGSTLYCYTRDLAALTRRALAAGALPAFPERNEPWGDRVAGFCDTEGHIWMWAEMASGGGGSA